MSTEPNDVSFGTVTQAGERVYYFQITNVANEALVELAETISDATRQTKRDGQPIFLILEAFKMTEVPTMFAARLALRYASKVTRYASVYAIFTSDDMARMAVLDSLITNFLRPFQIYMRFHAPSERAAARDWLREHGAVLDEAVLDELSQ